MKKGLFILLTVIVLLFTKNVFAESSVMTDWDSLDLEFANLGPRLSSWYNRYENEVYSSLDGDFWNSFVSYDLDDVLSHAILKLENDGLSSVSTDLELLKDDILSCKDKLDVALSSTINYLEENKEDGVWGSVDLFIKIKNVLSHYKEPSLKIIDYLINQELGYFDDEINTSNAPLNLFNETIAHFSNLEEMILFSKADLESLNSLYDEYDMEDYDDFFDEMLDEYINKFDGLLSILSSLTITRLEAVTEDNISEIVDKYDVDNKEDVIKRNADIENLYINLIEVSEETDDVFYDFANKILFSSIRNIIVDRFSEFADILFDLVFDVQSYLLPVTDETLKLKNSLDSKYINIDYEKRMIIYNQNILDADIFKARFSCGNYGIELDNLYDGNRFGTKSSLIIKDNASILEKYSLVVLGDVYPDGKISSLDYVRIKNHIMETSRIVDTALIKAADVDANDKISALDYVKVKNIILEG